MALKTDYKDYLPPETGRQFRITDAGSGLSTIEDATAYLQQGDTFGAEDINATNRQVNALCAGYSTAETQMPYTWVDGKAIWRKTIALSPLPNNGEKEFLAATGVDKAWFVEPCWLYQTTGEILNLISGYSYQGSEAASVDFYIRMKGTEAYIVLKSHRDRSGETAYATIEYTKA